MCIAIVTDRVRTSEREPGICTFRAIVRSASDDAQVHEADRLVGRAAARARDAGDPDADVRAEPHAHSTGHRLGNLGAHRAEPLDHLGRDTKLALLDLVGVRDDTAEDVGRRAGKLGEPRAEQSGRARLGGDDGAPLREQRIGDELVDRAPIGGEQRVRIGLLQDRARGRRRPAARRAGTW